MNKKINSKTFMLENKQIQQQWYSATQLAKYFGYARETMTYMLHDMVKRGQVRCIKPINPRTGGKGYPRYNMAEIETALLAIA